jgi:hypothetical protein
MNRKGRAVTSMKMDSIRFFEGQKLVTPGCSLKNLAQMTGVPLAKSSFPFRQFQSMSFLDLPELPADASEWSSELGASPSQEEVDGYRALFKASGFKTIECFLRTYLILDVKILLKSLTALINSYYDFTGLNVLDASKRTISSFAFSAAQVYLMRQKHVGMFTLNHARKQGLVQLGSRGGICMKLRSVIGEKADMRPYMDLAKEFAASKGVEPPTMEELSNCNAHIFGPDATYPCRYGISLDVGSLYPASCNYKSK